MLADKPGATRRSCSQVAFSPGDVKKLGCATRHQDGRDLAETDFYNADVGFEAAGTRQSRARAVLATEVVSYTSVLYEPEELMTPIRDASGAARGLP